jgi:hypothetical protein
LLAGGGSVPVFPVEKEAIMRRYLVALGLVGVAGLGAFLLWTVPRSTSAPLRLTEDEFARCPPRTDFEHCVFPRKFLQPWEEEQNLFTVFIKEKVDSLQRDKQAGKAIDEERQATYIELQAENNRRIRMRVLMTRAWDAGPSEKERRNCLRQLREEFPEEYGEKPPAPSHFPTASTPDVPKELVEEWHNAWLTICPPVSDVDKLPSGETLKEWQKLQEAYNKVIWGKVRQMEADWEAGGRKGDPTLMLHYGQLGREAYNVQWIRKDMQRIRHPTTDEMERRVLLRQLRVQHPEEYVSQKWPAPIPDVPPELQAQFDMACGR